MGNEMKQRWHCIWLEEGRKSGAWLLTFSLASERSERDTIRGVQIRAGAVRIYIYIYMCMEVRMSY